MNHRGVTLSVGPANKLLRMAGWLEQVGLTLTQFPTGIGIEAGTDLGKNVSGLQCRSVGLQISVADNNCNQVRVVASAVLATTAVW